MSTIQIQPLVCEHIRPFLFYHQPHEADFPQHDIIDIPFTFQFNALLLLKVKKAMSQSQQFLRAQNDLKKWEYMYLKNLTDKRK